MIFFSVEIETLLPEASYPSVKVKPEPGLCIKTRTVQEREPAHRISSVNCFPYLTNVDPQRSFSLLGRDILSFVMFSSLLSCPVTDAAR